MKQVRATIYTILLLLLLLQLLQLTFAMVTPQCQQVLLLLPLLLRSLHSQWR
jgi:hypothetical protein